MKCKKCPAEAMYWDLFDAYQHGWKSCKEGHHCSEHVAKDDFEHDHEIRCCMCYEEGTYVDLDDAIDYGWWVSEGWNFCSDHRDCAFDTPL
jgi:hypothetical protein